MDRIILSNRMIFPTNKPIINKTALIAKLRTKKMTAIKSLPFFTFLHELFFYYFPESFSG